eukprot:480694-Amphidinium_carterae.1
MVIIPNNSVPENCSLDNFVNPNNGKTTRNSRSHKFSSPSETNRRRGYGFDTTNFAVTDLSAKTL